MEEHVKELALLIQHIASRCWPDLGTDLSREIYARAGAVAAAVFLGDVQQPGPDDRSSR